MSALTHNAAPYMLESMEPRELAPHPFSNRADYRAPINPAALPRLYAMTAVGACMAPHIMEGQKVLADSVALPKGGDLVLLYFRPEFMPPLGNQLALKRLVGRAPAWLANSEPVPQGRSVPPLLVETHNPRRLYIVRCHKLLAVHKCLGPVPSNVHLVKHPAPLLSQRAAE